MKLLVDRCVRLTTVQALRNDGHDVEWVVEWEGNPDDEAVLAQAVADDRIVVTADKDFGEQVVRHGLAHKGVVLIRSYSYLREEHEFVCDALVRWSAALEQGSLLVVERERVRVSARPPAARRPTDPGA